MDLRETLDSCIVRCAENLHIPLDDPRSPAPLGALEYPEELRLKLTAFQRFLKVNSLPGKVARIEPSVQPRKYRTTSKRRAIFRRGRLELVMGYGFDRDASPVQDCSELETDLHTRLYSAIRELFSLEKYKAPAQALNYCILRGDADHAALILNLCAANGEIVRRLRMFGEDLRKREPGLQSMFLLVDPTRSDYYLEASARTGKARMFKKFFGPEMLCRPLGQRKLLYPPDAFSQVNDSMAEPFAETALAMLAPGEGARIFDLYCGYGLLSFAAVDHAERVTGVEWDGPAVRAAVAGAEYWKLSGKMRFLAGAVTPDFLKKRLPAAGGNEYFLLDPPRSGTAAGVIEAVAARKVVRAVHIFCGTDGIPGELRRWKACGYKIGEIRVLDMFPGTMNLETMVSLEPGE